MLVTFVQVWTSSHRDDPQPADAIVVLGAAQYNGTPSPVLQARLDHAIELYRDGVAPIVVVTGGRQSGDRVTEAKASADYLIARGVPDAAIRREVQGGDTWESLAATARFLGRDGAEDVVLVSDPYHSHRVAAIASEAGLNPVGVSPQTEVVPQGVDSAEVLARESLGVALGRLVGFRRLASYAG
ncbi:MAG: YdcF family protein [Acidimicrobiia bacterium]|nr:YdcF family protein [Acidimicrobiia bacterium]